MPKPARAKKQEIDPLVALADSIGDLDRELAPFQAKIKQLETEKKSLRGLYPEVPAEETITVHGTRWTIILGRKPADAQISAFTRAGSRQITIVPKAAS